MNRIKALFEDKKEDVLNIYFTAGYPNLQDTKEIILSLEKAGVDLIEVGMPYSDPLADGPTIQESGMKALENGMTLALLFEQLKEVRQQTEVPMVLMGYVNQMMRYGEERFIQDCKAAGVDGVILPDLPLFEYETYYREAFEAADIAISFLVTPQTSEERIQKVDELTKGFIYVVSDNSITGSKTGISDNQVAYFDKINQLDLQNSRLIGFGISSHDSFATACQYANGAIIGSAFIRALAKADHLEPAIHEFVQSIRGTVSA